MKSLKLFQLQNYLTEHPHEKTIWRNYIVSGLISTTIIFITSSLLFTPTDHSLPVNLFWLVLVGTAVGSVNALLYRRTQLKTRENAHDVQAERLRKMATRIKKLAYYDAATQLPNQLHFQRLLDRSVASASEKNSSFSIFLIDLGGFNAINEDHGHSAGQLVLSVTAERLRKIATPRNYLVTKPGESEFAIIIPKKLNDQHLYRFSQALLSRLNENISHDTHYLQPKISIGVARYPDHGTTSIEIRSSAALALRNAKEKDTEKACLFRESMRTRAIRSRNVGRKLQMNLASLGSTNFRLHYQPKVILNSGAVGGVEALLRWHDSELGYVNPLETFSVAEKTSDVVRLTQVLFDQILQDITFWTEESSTLIPVAFNLHPELFKQIDGLLNLVERLEHAKLPKDCVIFEITEDCIFGEGNSGSTGVLQTLVSKGYRLSLDDFGTGFASLTQLKDVPSQEIKIDRSFVFDIAENPESESIVKALLAIAKETGKNVVAEGIETEEQLRLLRYHGCEEGQGFLFSKAVPAESILELIHQPQPFSSKVELEVS